MITSEAKLALLRRRQAALIREGGHQDLSSKLAGLLLEQGFMPSARVIEALRHADKATERDVKELAGHLGTLRGDAPSLPQLRDFVRTQGGVSLEARLLAYQGIQASHKTSARCALRLSSGLQSEEAADGAQMCATGQLGSAIQGACEICHMRLNSAELPKLAQADRARRADQPLPRTVIDLVTPEELPGALHLAAQSLWGLSRPLSQDERADLLALHGALMALDDQNAQPELSAARLTALNAQDVPQREVRALLGGQLWQARGAEAAACLSRHWQASLTDILRLIDVTSGGDGTLARAQEGNDAHAYGLEMESAINALRRGRRHADLGRPGRRRAPHVKFGRLSRPERRLLAGLIEGSLRAQAPDDAWEQVSAYPEAFKRLMARLHVHELKAPLLQAYAGLLSAGSAEAAAGVLRPEAQAELRRICVGGEPRRFLARVEGDLEAGDLDRALARLRGRPGLMARMTDRLVRLEGGAAVSGKNFHAPLVTLALTQAAPHLKPELLAGLRSHLLGRTQPSPARSFRSRGKGTQERIVDTRPVFDPGLVRALSAPLEDELKRRGAALPQIGELNIDPDVLGYRVGLSARHSSGGNEGLAQGSRMRLAPSGQEPAQTARLFLHWAQPGHSSIDLDLSTASYDAKGQLLSLCSFHSLRSPGMVHSGDLRSAPLPTGATEYIDLDLSALRKIGVRTILASVHSFTSVPFSQMPRASTGLMVRRDTAEGARDMDPATTRVRFNLTGEITSVLLLALKLGSHPGDEEVVYLESAGDTRGLQTLAGDDRAELGLALTRESQGVALIDLLEVHAARAAQVRCGPSLWVRRESESPLDFAARVREGLDAVALGLSDEQSPESGTAQTEIIWVSEQLQYPGQRGYALQSGPRSAPFGAMLRELTIET